MFQQLQFLSNIQQNHQWIPKQAFLYFPQGSSTARQQDDYKIMLKNQPKRLIYQGGIQYLDEENTKIKQFMEFVKKKEITLDKRWSKTYIYKFLQSAAYDHKRTLKEILAHNDYKANLQAQDFQLLKQFAEPYLKQGPFYFNGRDAKYRPIIVCDIAKIHQMKMTQEQLQKSLQYFFEFMYRNMFINGQVENVVGIIDIGFTSPFDLVKPMKMTIGFLQGNYKYKLHAVYIIRSSSMFQFFYGIAQHLMKEDTIRKISVIEKDKPITKLLETVNRSQLEQRFGGSHPNLKTGEYWPPKEFSDDYSNPLVKRTIVSQEQYKEMYLKRLLPGRKIYLGFIEDETEGSNQVPLFNETKSVDIHLKISEAKIVQKTEKNIFQRTIQRFMCHGCFTAEQHRSKRSRKTLNQ